MFSLTGFATHLAKMVVQLEIERHHALEMAARIIEKEAKAEIGHRQSAAGHFAAWDPLADTTINGWRGHPGKADLGFQPPDYDPLLREGDMRDSIEHVVLRDTAHVGSNSMVAFWQELGTVNMPARSFLGGAAFRKKDEIGKLTLFHFVAVLEGRGISRTIPIT